MISDYCVCDKKSLSNEDIVKCSNSHCVKTLHLTCHKLKAQDQSNFECPGCILEFNDPMHEPICALIPIKRAGREKFELTIDDIYYKMIQSKTDDSFHLSIRFIKVWENFSTMHQEYWPDDGHMSINDKKIFFEELKIQGHRKSYKKFLTRQILRGSNSISIYFGPNSGVYYYGIFVTKKHTSETLKIQIKSTNKLTIENSKIFIQECFKNKIKTKTLNVSLKDNFGNLIETPVRGKFCAHVTCFSLEEHLKTNFNNPSRNWNCPICKSSAYHIFIDEYFMKIIDKIKEKNVSKFEINIYKNAAYEISLTPHKLKNEDSYEVDEVSFLKQYSIELFMQNIRKIVRNMSIVSKNEFQEIQEDLNLEFEKQSGRIYCDQLEEILRKHFDFEYDLSKANQNLELNIFDPFKYLLKEVKKYLPGKQFIFEFIQLMTIVKKQPAQNFKNEVSVLTALECMITRLEKVIMFRNFLIDIIKKKLVNNDIEASISTNYNAWKDYYSNYVNPPSEPAGTIQLSRGIEIISINDNKEFPLFVRKINAQRLNWSFDSVICSRKNLWKILWNAENRWFKVDYQVKNEHIASLINQDPFYGMLVDDISLIMPHLLYLKTCWRVEMMKNREIKNNLLFDEDEDSDYNGTALRIVAPYFEIDVNDYIMNEYINEKYLNEIIKIINIKSFKKDWNENLKKLVSEFCIDQL